MFLFRIYELCIYEIFNYERISLVMALYNISYFSTALLSFIGDIKGPKEYFAALDDLYIANVYL